MISRIGDFINPPQAKGDTSEKVAEHPDHKNRRSRQQKDEAAADQDDGTFFSIEAIRALLQQENVEAGNEAISCLDLLRQHGVASIPIRNGQSIIAAITEATARLQGK